MWSRFLGQSASVVIAREVTKIHEEFLRGRAGEVLETLNARGDIKGEITLLIGKAEETEQKIGGRRERAPAAPADHGGREAGRESGAQENRERDGSIEERSVPGVAAEPLTSASWLWSAGYRT